MKDRKREHSTLLAPEDLEGIKVLDATLADLLNRLSTENLRPETRMAFNAVLAVVRGLER